MLKFARTSGVLIALAAGMAPADTAWAASSEIGNVIYARGVATAQVADGDVRLLGTGSELLEGDVVNTAARSYAVLKLSDGTRMTVRPGTVLSLQAFKPKQQSALMRLFKGGLRMITGFISKRNPDGFRLRTSLATIGIRGTDFEARLCDRECVAESRRIKRRPSVNGSPVAGRLVFRRGRVTAVRGTRKAHGLALGAAVLAGDIIATGPRGVAVIAFRDRSRVTLRRASRFKIERMHYQPAAPEKDGLFMRLFKGGLRAVTGLIGKRNRNKVKISFATATIGIRGTGFDLVCAGECGPDTQPVRSSTNPVSGISGQFTDDIVRPAYAAQEPQALVHFFLGAGYIETPGGRRDLATGQTAQVLGAGRPTLVTGPTPMLLQQLQQAPNPSKDKESLDPKYRKPGAIKGLFSSKAPGTLGEDTLVVTVHDGDVTVDEVPVGPGETGVAGGEGPTFRTPTDAVPLVPLASPDIPPKPALPPALIPSTGGQCV